MKIVYYVSKEYPKYEKHIESGYTYLQALERFNEISHELNKRQDVVDYQVELVK